ncbi:MAG: hypothetical protein ABMA13_18275, partial [Chthoniobacteraceae bacterium]
GLERYDVLKQFNEQKLVDPSQLATLVRGVGKDAEATLTVIRKGQEQKLTVKIGEKMLPERRGGMPDMEQLRRRTDEMFRGGGDQGRESQERIHAFQERMRTYLREMNDWQEKLRQWHEKREGEMPKAPPFPNLDMAPQRRGGANEPGDPLDPVDILRGPRAGAQAEARTEWSDGASRWDASSARMVMRDREGEAELTMKDGKRTLTVKNPAGEIVFSGPVDTAGQRDAIPENLRKKLSALEAAPKPQPGPDRYRVVPREQDREPFAPQRQREPEVQ